MLQIRYGKDKGKLLLWMIPWFLDHLRARALHCNNNDNKTLGENWLWEKMRKIIILVFDMLVWRDFETVKC